MFNTVLLRDHSPARCAAPVGPILQYRERSEYCSHHKSSSERVAVNVTWNQGDYGQLFSFLWIMLNEMQNLSQIMEKQTVEKKNGPRGSGVLGCCSWERSEECTEIWLDVSSYSFTEQASHVAKYTFQHKRKYHGQTASLFWATTSFDLILWSKHTLTLHAYTSVISVIVKKIIFLPGFLHLNSVN